MEQIKSFIAENRLALFIGILLLVLICWLHAGQHRNDGIHHDTDSTVADLEKRIQSAEQRIDGMSKRIEQNQKTIESVERGISTSTGLAIEIEEGTGRAEDRLESAIARTERIKGIIADIEKSNR
ncbi:MAG: hypothetical protein IKE94_13805 [Aeriscardovia sp.]|nr:hypothetical protein [Aeriscardovia sp.]